MVKYNLLKGLQKTVKNIVIMLGPLFLVILMNYVQIIPAEILNIPIEVGGLTMGSLLKFILNWYKIYRENKKEKN